MGCSSCPPSAAGEINSSLPYAICTCRQRSWGSRWQFAGAGFLLPKRLLVLLPVVLTVLAGADSYRFAAKWMPFDEKRFVYPTLPVITKTQALIAGEHGRVFGTSATKQVPLSVFRLSKGYDAVISGSGTVDLYCGGVPECRGRPERSVVRFDRVGNMLRMCCSYSVSGITCIKKLTGDFPWAYPFWEFPQYNRVWEDGAF